MKVNVINNTNFKGLFIDKTKENNGNWKMEYRPYSWEMKNDGEYIMAPQTEWDLFSDKLPDNEKKYFDMTDGSKDYCCFRGEKYCIDSLGTKFYSKNYGLGTVKDRITQVEPMNREESLTVLNKKLKNFMKMKKDLMYDKISKVPSEINSVNDSSRYIGNYTSDINSGMFSREHSLDYSTSRIDYHTKTMKDSAHNIADNFNDYVKINDSLETVRKQYENNEAEIKLLKTARGSGNLIDISRRDIYDPNHILWEALHNIKIAAGKIIALPHKTISVNELLQMVKKNVKESQIADEAIKIVDQMIRHKV